MTFLEILGTMFIVFIIAFILFYSLCYVGTLKKRLDKLEKGKYK